jgi:flagellar biosynthesis protein FlhA
VRIVAGEGTASGEFEVRLFGTRFGRTVIHSDRLLAVSGRDRQARLEGLEASDTTLDRPAFWIRPDQVSDARDRGFSVAGPTAVMTAHLADIIRGEAANLLTRPVITELVDGARRRQPGLVDDLIPTVLSLADVQRVLRNLLAENVSVARFDLLLEHMLDLSRQTREPDVLSELLRQRIGFAICDQLRGAHRDLAVVSLDPRLENELTGILTSGAAGIDPRIADTLVRRLSPLYERMFREGRAPVLLCGNELRKAIKTLTRRALPRLAVIGVGEIPERIELSSFDVVRLDA